MIKRQPAGWGDLLKTRNTCTLDLPSGFHWCLTLVHEDLIPVFPATALMPSAVCSTLCSRLPWDICVIYSLCWPLHLASAPTDSSSFHGLSLVVSMMLALTTWLRWLWSSLLLSFHMPHFSSYSHYIKTLRGNLCLSFQTECYENRACLVCPSCEQHATWHASYVQEPSWVLANHLQSLVQALPYCSWKDF